MTTATSTTARTGDVLNKPSPDAVEAFALAEIGQGRCTAFWIAKQRRVARPVVSAALQRLKRRGLVECDGASWARAVR